MSAENSKDALNEHTPGERVNSEGSRGFNSPRLHHLAGRPACIFWSGMIRSAPRVDLAAYFNHTNTFGPSDSQSWARSFRSFDFSRARHAFHVVEYGQVMCPPGDEDAWFATLPNNIKEGLQSVT